MKNTFQKRASEVTSRIIFLSRHGPLSFFFLLIASTGFSQPTAEDKIDHYVQRRMAELHIPGVALAVIQNGNVLKEGYYGISNIEYSIPVTRESVFEIASMSKQFTCAAVLLLQEDGKLSITDKVSQYLAGLPDSWQEMTIQQLMNHTSGLRDDWDEGTSYFLKNNTDSAMFEAQKKFPLLFKPGESFHYSSGPFTLGLVIAKVSGTTYAQFLKERIFQPLGMNSTSIYDDKQIVPHRAAGYIFKDGILMNGADIPSAAEARGDVGVITSMPDMIKWDAALNDDRLLNNASRSAMFTQGKLNDATFISYGYGWSILPSLGQVTIEHGGGFRTGFNSMIHRVPDLGMTVIALCNQWNSGAYSMTASAASFYHADLQPISERQVKVDPDKKRTATLRNLMMNVSNKTWSDADLYKLANFCGDDSKFLARMLKGMKDLIYIDGASIKGKPLHLYGEEITQTLFYKAIGDKPTYWSFSYNDKGKLVSVYWEE